MDDGALTGALAQATGSVAHLAGLPATEWDEVDGGGLVGLVHEVARARAQLDAVLVEATARIEATDAAGAAGWASTKDFLTHALGEHRGAGGGLVRAARQLAELPQVRAAVADGRISLAQARVIGAEVAALPRHEPLRVAAADRLLALALDHAVDATGPSATPTPSATGPWSLVPDAYGGVKVRGYGTLEDAELIKTILMPLAAPVTTEPGACGAQLPAGERWGRDEHGRRLMRPCPDPACAHDGRDPREHGTRMWDALVEACSRLQAAGDLPQQHGTATRLVVTISEDSLRERTGGLLPDGERLSVAAVRRLACDAEILPAVLGSESQVLDVGRARRLVTSAIWLALVLRDRHCTFPGCTRLPIACDAHHLTHGAEGGTTSLDNLTLLCRRHHVLTHHSPWTLVLDPTTRRPVWTPPPDLRRHPTYTYNAATGPPGIPLAS